MATLDEALKQIPFKKNEYFKWKFDIRYDQRLPKKTKEEFLRYVNMKTLNSFTNWEKSPEYHALLQLLLQYRSTQDFEIIYSVVSKSAKDGDEKSIKLFIDLQKQINANVKLANAIFKKMEDDDDIDDGLEL